MARGPAGSLILDARLQTGLSQRALAAKAKTSPAAIAAYEAGRRQPSLDTLIRILLAAGFDLRMRLAPHDTHDEVLQDLWNSLTPEARKESEENVRRFFESARLIRG